MLNYTTNETNRKSGNKCGHCPSTPRFFKAPEDHGKRPLILLRFTDTSADLFYPNPNLLAAIKRRQRFRLGNSAASAAKPV